MSNLTRLFTIGQIVRCRMDKKFYKGIVKETYPDHIVVDIPEISEHCWFENDFNMDCVYPECNFQKSINVKKKRASGIPPALFWIRLILFCTPVHSQNCIRWK